MPPHFKRDKIQKNERKDKYIVFRKKYINNKMNSNHQYLDKSFASQNYLRY